MTATEVRTTHELARVPRRGLAAAASVVALVGLTLAALPPAAGAASTEVLSSVSCVKQVCIAVGSTDPSGGQAVVARSKDGGVTWVAQKAPSSTEALNGVSCGSSTSCLAVGEKASGAPVIVASPPSGSKWIAQKAPGADGDLTTVACPTTLACWAGGYSTGFLAGAIARTTNGGTTWSPESVPGGTLGVAGVSGIACRGSSVLHCFATGFFVHYFQFPYLMTSTSKETSWASVAVENTSSGRLTAVSCATQTSCAAVGQVNNAAYILTTSDGVTWTPRAAPMGFSSLNGVSCPATTTCFAVGSLTSGAAGIALTTDGGSTWTAQSAPAGTGALASVSCTSDAHCVAAGSLGSGGAAVIATTNGGHLWSPEAFLVP